MSMRPNERSSNFIAPSTSNGCAMACAYCYVPRRKGYANPITVFVNIEQICAALARHASRQGVKRTADQVDPKLWVYDLGENGDLSVDALVSDLTEISKKTGIPFDVRYRIQRLTSVQFLLSAPVEAQAH
jgi:spore photoproduct lyase